MAICPIQVPFRLIYVLSHNFHSELCFKLHYIVLGKLVLTHPLKLIYLSVWTEVKNLFLFFNILIFIG